MNIDEIITKNKILEEELQKTEEELQKTKDELSKTKEHLKKYTAPSNKKQYYENHKEEIKQKVKEYRETTNYVVSPEIIKERNKKAYLKRKEKMNNENI